MEWWQTPLVQSIVRLVIGMLIVLVGKKFEEEEKGVLSHLAFMMMLFGVYLVIKAILSLLNL